MIKYFIYSQCNSHGVFHVDDNITEYVIVSAPSADLANVFLESIGGYFNGISHGVDCPCCGDRWEMANEGDAMRFPCVRFGQAFYSVSEYAVYMAMRTVGVQNPAVWVYDNGIKYSVSTGDQYEA